MAIVKKSVGITTQIGTTWINLLSWRLYEQQSMKQVTKIILYEIVDETGFEGIVVYKKTETRV